MDEGDLRARAQGARGLARNIWQASFRQNAQTPWPTEIRQRPHVHFPASAAGYAGPVEGYRARLANPYGRNAKKGSLRTSLRFGLGRDRERRENRGPLSCAKECGILPSR